MTNEADTQELLPELLLCPFCGSTPRTGITGAPECDNWRYVQCSNEYCDIRHSLFTVKRWNTRADLVPSTSPPAEAQKRKSKPEGS